jgi:hypothetical protein
MIDANQFETSEPGRKTLVFRFHYLPDNVSDGSFQTFFKETKLNIKIESITRECYREFADVRNGTVRVKVTFNDDLEDKVRNLTGYSKYLFGLKTLITIAGEKNKCFFCNSLEHSIKDCEVKKLTCNKCNNKGHTSEKCDLSERLKALNRAEIDESDYVLVENSGQTAVENGTSSSGQHINSDLSNDETIQQQQGQTNTEAISNEAMILSNEVSNSITIINVNPNESLNLIDNAILNKSGINLTDAGEVYNTPDPILTMPKSFDHAKFLNNVLNNKNQEKQIFVTPTVALPEPINLGQAPISLGTRNTQRAAATQKRNIENAASPNETTSTPTTTNNKNTSQAKKSKNILQPHSNGQTSDLD